MHLCNALSDTLARHSPLKPSCLLRSDEGVDTRDCSRQLCFCGGCEVCCELLMGVRQFLMRVSQELTAVLAIARHWLDGV